MKKVKTPNGAVAYQVHGEGTPLVMLRGLGRTTRHWVGFDREMAKKYRVIITDLRGMGETEVRHGFLDTIWDYADDLVRVLDDAGVDSAHIMGVSLGGMATLATGIRYPARAKSLMLVNSSIGGQKLPRITLDAVRLLAKGIVTRSSSLQPTLVDLLVGPDCSKDRRSQLIEAYNQITRDQGLYVNTVVKQLIAALRFDPGPYLPSLKVPTMIVYGTEDRFVPTANSINLANVIPHAHLAVIPGAGHEISADKGEDLAKTMSSWIESCEAS
jgi:3-oxoadipate enol-lactonase